jgi:nucleotide-binding universal stress UspA family protein
VQENAATIKQRKLHNPVSSCSQGPMTESTKPYVILVGIDYSTASELALQKALTLTLTSGTTELHVMHVVTASDRHNHVATVDPPLENEQRAPLTKERTAQAYDQLLAHVAISVGVFAKSQNRLPLENYRLTAHLRHSEPAHELAQLAADVEADLVVVGMRGRGTVSRFFMGSVAESTARLCPCSVLVVRPKGLPPDYPKIEPPCPRCVETRFATHGEQFWCEQHSEHHGQRHVYFQRDVLAQDSNFPLVFPER